MVTHWWVYWRRGRWGCRKYFDRVDSLVNGLDCLEVVVVLLLLMLILLLFPIFPELLVLAA